MTKGYINSIVKSSIVDGFGNRLAIFMQGCNFNCWYCHNPETIVCNKKIEYSVQELYDQTRKYFSFIDGITFSGGEALLQQQFIIEYLRLVRQSDNINVLIDTNGGVKIDSELISLVDGFMLDVKCVDEEEHIKLTGVSNKQVLSNLHVLVELNKLCEVRTVLYPNYNHNHTIDYVKDVVGNSITYKLLEYHTKGVREEFL